LLPCAPAASGAAAERRGQAEAIPFAVRCSTEWSRAFAPPPRLASVSPSGEATRDTKERDSDTASTRADGERDWIMLGPGEPETFRICLEMEIAGIDEEVRAALAVNARERGDLLRDSGDITSQPGSSTQEQALIWILDALQLEEQIRRVLRPLTVHPVNGGLKLSRITSADSMKS
jgi:hypothetical protein